jgi:hypothetical protein
VLLHPQAPRPEPSHLPAGMHLARAACMAATHARDTAVPALPANNHQRTAAFIHPHSPCSLPYQSATTWRGLVRAPGWQSAPLTRRMLPVFDQTSGNTTP